MWDKKKENLRVSERAGGGGCLAEATGSQLYVGVSDTNPSIPSPFLLAFPRLSPDYEAVPWRRQAHQCTASNRNPEGLSHISTLRAHLNDVERGGISSLLQIGALEQRGLLLSPAGPLLVLIKRARRLRHSPPGMPSFFKTVLAVFFLRVWCCTNAIEHLD